MGFQCGLVGLPNAGKTTIFNALTAGQAAVGPFPFTTIEANVGVVAVPDSRLVSLAELLKPPEVTPTTLRFVDIAGLVKGASEGHGLGNQFLGKIREVDAIAHVVRLFPDPDVAHPMGDVDPLRDMEIVETELILADLEWLDKRAKVVGPKARAGDKEAVVESDFLKRIQDRLDRGEWLFHSGEAKGRREEDWLHSYPLLTERPILYLLNASDDPAVEELKNSVEALLKDRGAGWVVIDGKFEAELTQLAPEEAAEFLADAGRSEPAVADVIREGYRLLNLVTFYTTVGTELRAWTVPAGTPVTEAAGKIHSDMERGFIRAEVLSFDDLMQNGSVEAAKEAGVLRLEGHDYLVQDGDVIKIRFKV